MVRSPRPPQVEAALSGPSPRPPRPPPLTRPSPGAGRPHPHGDGTQHQGDPKQDPAEGPRRLIDDHRQKRIVGRAPPP